MDYDKTHGDRFMVNKSILVVLLAFLITACSNPTIEPTVTLSPTRVVETTTIPTSSSTPTPTRTSTPTKTRTPTKRPTATPTSIYPSEGFGPEEFPIDINPLTGTYVEDAELLERRPVAIKVNIVPRYNRPPWGLSLADIVYDYYHNNGYTRFHAIYYGNDAEMVGPIRSGRFPDDQLIKIYESIFVYGSADPIINGRFFWSEYYDRLVLESGQTIQCPPEPTNPFCRFDPNGYNFLISGTSEVHSYVADRNFADVRQDLTGMFFQDTPPKGGKAGEEVLTVYSLDTYNKWVYDPNLGKYLRFQDNLYLDQGQEEEYVPLIDQLTDEQISAHNVVILLVPHSFFRKPPNEIIEIEFNNSGPAYIFRDGAMYEVVWNRPATTGVLYLTDQDGEPFPFKHGNTWFQVIGDSSESSQENRSSWRFIHKFP
jgi:hypothetical protein